MKQIFHHYETWEDFKNGMYNVGRQSEEIITNAEFLLNTPDKLKEVMLSVVNTWSIASEQNLSNRSRNRQAWLGQAACCKEHGTTEVNTKAAWNRLYDWQKKAANEIADEVIKFWEAKQLQHA